MKKQSPWSRLPKHYTHIMLVVLCRRMTGSALARGAEKCACF